VDVRFTALPDGSTRVDLQHRHLARMGARAEVMRAALDSASGWSGVLDLFAHAAQQTV
jgi:hypothetical protein